MKHAAPLSRAQLANKALKEYITLLTELSQDHTLATQHLHDHAAYLELEINKLEQEDEKIRSDLRKSGLKTDAPQAALEKKLLDNIQQDIATFRRAIRYIEHHSSEAAKEITSFANKSLRTLKALKFIDKEGDYVAFENVPRSDLIERFYKHDDAEILRRYVGLDLLYAAGKEFVFREKFSEKRAVKTALIPTAINQAKWNMMVSVQNAVHQMGLHEEHIGFISLLFTDLSRRERALGNPVMPESHKLRHNPAIHSQHTATLVDKIFDHAEKVLETKPGPHATQIKAQLLKRRAFMVLSALIHDGGEAKYGELSVASKRDSHAESLEKKRELIESDAFKQKAAEYIRKLGLFGTKATALLETVTKALHLAEQTDTFDGRMLKVLERIQSQHDYIRFGKEKHGGQDFSKAEESNKNNFLEYVAKVLYDSRLVVVRGHQRRPPQNDAERVEALLNMKRGKDALENLIGRSNVLERPINQALYDAVELEYQKMFRTLAKKIGIDDDTISKTLANLQGATISR